MLQSKYTLDMLIWFPFCSDWRSSHTEKEDGTVTEICQWWLTGGGGGVKENAGLMIGSNSMIDSFYDLPEKNTFFKWRQQMYGWEQFILGS